MFGFSFFDLIAVAAYIAATIAIGLRARLRKETREEYFLGGRRFGTVVQTFASFGQATTADGPVGVATTAFHNGVAGVWTTMLLVFSTPLFWVSAPLLRRLRLLTMADFYVERYGSKGMAATYVAIATIGTMGVVSAGYIAVAKTAMAMTLLPLSHSIVIWAICGIVVLGAVTGGLAAAFYTAVLQGCLILVLSVILIPFGVARINALYGGRGFVDASATLHAHLPRPFFQIFGSPRLPDFTWYYLAAVSALAGITILTMPNQLVTSAAARDESVARIGMVGGLLIKRFCAIAWALCGLLAVMLYGGSLRDSDLAWGYAARDLLAPAGMGLVGLMLAGMLSALMASANSLMLTMSGLITNNLYRPLRPAKSERHYVAVGRGVGVLFLCGSALIASQFDTLLEVLKFTWEFFGVFSAAFWLGLKWRRANRAGAWASILLTFGVFYLIPVTLPAMLPRLRTHPTWTLRTEPQPFAPSRGGGVGGTSGGVVGPEARSIFWSQGVAPDLEGRFTGRGYPYLDLLLLQTTGFNLQKNSYALNETIRILIRLLAPFAIFIVVAGFTSRDNAALTKRFFDKMRTPVSGQGAAADAAQMALSAANPARLRVDKLFTDSDWEFYKWNRRDTVGLIVAVGSVFVVVGLLAAVTSIGR